MEKQIQLFLRAYTADLYNELKSLILRNTGENILKISIDLGFYKSALSNMFSRFRYIPEYEKALTKFYIKTILENEEKNIDKKIEMIENYFTLLGEYKAFVKIKKGFNLERVLHLNT